MEVQLEYKGAYKLYDGEWTCTVCGRKLGGDPANPRPHACTQKHPTLHYAPTEAHPVPPFLIAVAEELRRAREKHPTNIHNVAEGYAVILEELDEFWDEVKAQTGERDEKAMLKELVQVAAMCARTAEDAGLIGTTDK